MVDRSVDTLIIGAGVIGSSVAMHLAIRGLTGIRVVDFDLEGSLSSSELNAGGVRGTWNQEINILASKLSIDYFAQHANEVGYRNCGYLWLCTPERLAAKVQAAQVQNRLGWPVEVWDVSTLRSRVPLIDRVDDLAGAVFGKRDGLVNPNLLKNHYREEARKRGVVFEDRVRIRQAEYLGAKKVRVTAERFPVLMEVESKISTLGGEAYLGEVEKVHYTASRVINCAGPWAPMIAGIFGYSCPSHPVRRQISIFDCRDADLSQYGMIIDTSGVYFHPEATNGLAGFADPTEPAGVNYTYDGEDFFMEKIWASLYERSTAFERLRHLTGWAGLYEVSPDESAIIGEVRLGDAGRSGIIFEAHSYSGHGVMHSVAAGQLLSEKITLGRYETLDFEPLNGDRFEKNSLIRENMII